MGTKVLIGLLVIIGITNSRIIFVDEYINISDKVDDALSLCESEPRFSKGYETWMVCPNLLGGTWQVKCCDFDPGYLFYCNSIPCN